MNRIFKTNPRQLPYHTLGFDLMEISRRTWSLLKNAHDSDSPINEETITEINLLELKLKQPKNISIWSLSKYDERLIGADWIWAFTSKNGRTVILYVQAKRLFPKKQAYKSMIETEQAKKLIGNALSMKLLGFPAYPIYLFYNYFESHANTIQCNCGAGKDVTLSGCSYADAIEVYELIKLGKKNLSDVYPLQYSWECLVCKTYCHSISSAKKDLASRVFEQLTFQKGTPNKSNFSIRPELLESRPPIIESIINGEQPPADRFLGTNLGGIIVFHESKDSDD